MLSFRLIARLGPTYRIHLRAGGQDHVACGNCAEGLEVEKRTRKPLIDHEEIRRLAVIERAKTSERLDYSDIRLEAPWFENSGLKLHGMFIK